MKIGFVQSDDDEQVPETGYAETRETEDTDKSLFGEKTMAMLTWFAIVYGTISIVRDTVVLLRKERSHAPV